MTFGESPVQCTESRTNLYWKYFLKIMLLHGIREYFLDMLKFLGKGDILKVSFEDIVDLCQIYLRGFSITNNWDKGLDRYFFTRTQKSSNGGATWEKI